VTTYNINLPDKCPRCKKAIHPLSKSGRPYAQLIDCTVEGVVPAGQVPHRAPILILAGTEAEEVTVFNVICLECHQEENKVLLTAANAGRELLEAATRINKMKEKKNGKRVTRKHGHGV